MDEQQQQEQQQQQQQQRRRREELYRYYKDWYPLDTLYEWLTLHAEHSAEMLFSRRELVFVTPSGAFPRADTRCGTAHEFRAELLRRVPARIESVTVNSVAYARRVEAGPGFVRVEKDLAFDIDIDDYDSVRACCSNASYCRACWTPLIGAAVQFLTETLRRTYGHSSVFWVFSGRRGMHAWVVSSRARRYAPETRAALVDALVGVRAAAEHADTPPYQRKILVAAMYRYLAAQPRLLASAKVVRTLADALFATGSTTTNCALPTESSLGAHSNFIANVTAMQRKCGKSGVVVRTWLEQVYAGNATARRRSELRIAATLCAPRIDEPVTRSFEHAIKLPFCVHPATDNVCVPMHVDDARTFYPDAASVVKLASLISDTGRDGGEGDDACRRAHDSFSRGIDVVRKCVHAAD